MNIVKTYDYARPVSDKVSAQKVTAPQVATPVFPARIARRADEVATKFGFGRLIDGPSYTGEASSGRAIDMYGSKKWALVYQKGTILFTPQSGRFAERFEANLRGTHFDVVNMSGEFQSAPISDGLMKWAQTQDGTIRLTKIVGGGVLGEKNLYYVNVDHPDGAVSKYVVRTDGEVIRRGAF